MILSTEQKLKRLEDMTRELKAAHQVAGSTVKFFATPSPEIELHSTSAVTEVTKTLIFKPVEGTNAFIELRQESMLIKDYGSSVTEKPDVTQINISGCGCRIQERQADGSFVITAYAQGMYVRIRVVAQGTSDGVFEIVD